MWLTADKFSAVLGSLVDRMETSHSGLSAWIEKKSKKKKKEEKADAVRPMRCFHIELPSKKTAVLKGSTHGEGKYNTDGDDDEDGEYELTMRVMRMRGRL